MILKDITLLSAEMFEKYKPIIPVTNTGWWLKTSCSAIDKWVNDVSDSGNMTLRRCDTPCGVRPLCVFFVEFSDAAFWCKPKKLIGTTMWYGGFCWTILDVVNDEIYALCNITIEEHKFDCYSTIWETSELRRWLKSEGLKLITT